MNICLSSKYIYCNPTHKVMVLGGGDFGSWLGHEGEVLMNGISVLIKKTPDQGKNKCYGSTENNHIHHILQFFSQISFSVIHSDQQELWTHPFFSLTVQCVGKTPEWIAYIPQLWTILIISSSGGMADLSFGTINFQIISTAPWRWWEPKSLKPHCTWLQGHKQVMLMTVQSVKHSDASKDLHILIANYLTQNRMKRVTRSFTKSIMKILILTTLEIFFVPNVTFFFFFFFFK